MSASISHIQSLVAIIRRDLLAAQANHLPRKKEMVARRKPASTHAGRPFQARLAARIAGITADDPQSGHKALKAFIEAVLLAELGDQLLNDPAFYQMTDTIADHILSEPALAEDVKAAVAHLVAPVAG